MCVNCNNVVMHNTMYSLKQNKILCRNSPKVYIEQICNANYDIRAYSNIVNFIAACAV